VLQKVDSKFQELTQERHSTNTHLRDFGSNNSWVGLRDSFAACGLVIITTLVFIGVSVFGAKYISTTAFEAGQAYALVASEATVGVFLDRG